MSDIKRPCPICGALMKAWTCKRYCSHKCRQKGYRLRARNAALNITESTRGTLATRCVNCGDKIHNPRLDRKYCSARCKQAMYRQNKRFAQEENRADPDSTSEVYVQLAIPESAYTITNRL